jgi:hypothetical protein
MFNFYFELFGVKSIIILSKKGKICPKKSLNILKADWFDTDETNVKFEH